MSSGRGSERVEWEDGSGRPSCRGELMEPRVFDTGASHNLS